MRWRGIDDTDNLFLRLLRMPFGDPVTFWSLVALGAYQYGFYKILLWRYI
jgi:hypothetical protein